MAERHFTDEELKQFGEAMKGNIKASIHCEVKNDGKSIVKIMGCPNDIMDLAEDVIAHLMFEMSEHVDSADEIEKFADSSAKRMANLPKNIMRKMLELKMHDLSRKLGAIDDDDDEEEEEDD